MFLLEGLIGGGFLCFPLWFQFPDLSRIRAREADALRGRVLQSSCNGCLWMCLPFFQGMPGPLCRNSPTWPFSPQRRL